MLRVKRLASEDVVCVSDLRAFVLLLRTSFAFMVAVQGVRRGVYSISEISGLWLSYASGNRYDGMRFTQYIQGFVRSTSLILAIAREKRVQSRLFCSNDAGGGGPA